MKLRLAFLLRVLNRLLSLVALLVFIAFVGGALVTYLTVSQHSGPMLRGVAAQLGTLVQGQRTEQMTLDVRVDPQTSRLSGSAILTVRSPEAGRQRFYFLLNDGLRIRSVRVTGSDTHVVAPSTYRLWLLTVVDVGAPVPRDTTIQLTFDYDGPIAPGLFGTSPSIVNGQQVLLPVESFWYPNDLQSFFAADVTVTLPTTWTLVHNGAAATRTDRGDAQLVHWTSERPINGFALVAGAYELTVMHVNGITYRLYLPPTIGLDRSRILDTMASVDRTFDTRYGPSAFKQVTMFVADDLQRAFNDGSGLVAMALHDFRAGDYGFGSTAHEIAHNWWGATVAENRLAPGTGSHWIVEGFAEFSSLVAVDARYGRDALTRRLAGEFYDPDRPSSLARMSVWDNAQAEATVRDTISSKGAYVAFMLRDMLGEEAYFRALRQFVDRFRYQPVTDTDLQHVLQEATEQDLAPYFADWVRSDKRVDLSLDGPSGTDLTVSNLGTAVVPGRIDLWKFHKAGGDPLRSTVQIGDHVQLEDDIAYAVLDPQLNWADVQRDNNRYPRRNDPLYVASTPRGATAITRGTALPWARTAVSSVDDGGSTLHTWDLSRGLTIPPAWSPDAARIIVSQSTADTPFPAIVTLAADGAQRTVAYGTAPAGGTDSTIYAARVDRIVGFSGDGTETTVLQRCADVLDAPLPSPDGQRLLYTAAHGGRREVRLAQLDGTADRLVLSRDRDRLVYRWSPDGSRLYAIVGGAWDWQIWQIPLGPEPVQVLAASAAAITDLAISPAGTALAFTAAPALDYPNARRRLYVMNLQDRRVQPVDVPEADLSHVAWTGAEDLLVVAAAARQEQPWILPEPRALKRVHLPDGSVEDVR